jgi:hypothetical protein
VAQNGDALSRAKKALAPPKSGAVVPADRARRNDLIALPRAAAARPAQPIPAKTMPVEAKDAALIERVKKAAARPMTARHALLVFAVDATESRSTAWEVSRELTDDLINALPGQLHVALAVFGGNTVHTFTPFLSNAHELRKIAAGINCMGGRTMLNPILRRALEEDGVNVVTYIGDSFEESAPEAYALADALKDRGTRVIVLYDRVIDQPGFTDSAAGVFAAIAAKTGGAVLPFDISSVAKLKKLLAAIAALAVGGIALLERQKSPGAVLLLEHMDAAKRIGRG